MKQGKNYAAEALGYRDKIADLSLGFIKDDSVVGVSFRDDGMILKLIRPLLDSDALLLEGRHEDPSSCT